MFPYFYVESQVIHHVIHFSHFSFALIHTNTYIHAHTCRNPLYDTVVNTGVVGYYETVDSLTPVSTFMVGQAGNIQGTDNEKDDKL